MDDTDFIGIEVIGWFVKIVIWGTVVTSVAITLGTGVDWGLIKGGR